MKVIAFKNAAGKKNDHVIELNAFIYSPHKYCVLFADWQANRRGFTYF